jgi:hypothetical protein
MGVVGTQPRLYRSLRRRITESSVWQTRGSPCSDDEVDMTSVTNKNIGFSARADGRRWRFYCGTLLHKTGNSKRRPASLAG